MKSFQLRICSASSLNVMSKIFVARLNTVTVDFDTNKEPVNRFEQIPGLPTLPLIGPLHNFLPFIGTLGSAKNLYDITKTVHETFGPIVRMPAFLNQHYTVFLSDPDDFEQVLRNESTMPHRSGFEALGYFRKNIKGNRYEGSTGLVTENGESWKKFRSTVNPVMLLPRTIKFYAAAIDQVAQDMVTRLKKIRKADNSISGNFEVELNKWALESIALVGLGGRIGCLEDDLPENSPARQLIQCVRDTFDVTDALDFKPSLWRHISTPMYIKAMKTFTNQIELTDMFIKKALADFKKLDNDGRPAEDRGILEKLLEIDPNVALIMASDMLIAGVDTAAHTMLNLLYNLAKNPEKQHILRQEIRSGVERKYLRACTKENLRLSPVVSVNTRTTTKELKLRNHSIPKGIVILLAHEYISREESQYPRAKEFIPERWLVSKEDPLHYSSAHPMATMPFGHGVRSCIGRRIAELEVETFLARVIENFEVQWDGPPRTIVTKGINYMIPPYNYIFRDVK